VTSPVEAPERALPLPASGLSVTRRWAGVALAAVTLPGLTVLLRPLVDDVRLGSLLLLYLLAVVVVATVGGLWPGVVAAVAAVLVANWFLTPPYNTLVVESRDSVIELVVFAVVAITVSVAVELAARDRSRARRSRMEADLLSGVAASPAASIRVADVLEQVRSTFGMASAALVRTSRTGETTAVASAGPPVDTWDVTVHAGGDLSLVLAGPELFAEDRAVLGRLAAAAARAWETQHLSTLADRLAEAEQVRSALLAAVGHDLRTPLAGLKAAVSSLRQGDVAWTDEERAELLATIEESADRLGYLIANLLDMTRIQMGALRPQASDVAVDELVALAVLDLPAGVVALDVPDDMPLVRVDPVLLERVVANLLDNAARHSPAGSPVEVGARQAPGIVRLTISDHGSGVPEHLWEAMFQPFQRLDDRAVGTGTGLGLAIVQGFCSAMGVPVHPGPTPGGGLTMTLDLPLARA
jgi:two-component system sensor histidine kinase KdpD